MNHDQLRDKDIAVLQAIHNGASDTSQIREATTLTNREINYSLSQYLQTNDLVQIDRSEGREQREINGHQRNIWKPKHVELTDKGLQRLVEHDTEKRYQDMSQRELIERIHELETRLDRMESVFKDFRSRVKDQL